MLNKNQRPIDITAQETLSWWNKSFVFIKKTEIKTWQAIFITAFATGVASALVWGISTDRFSSSKAAGNIVAPSDTCIAAPAGGSFTSPTPVAIACGANVTKAYYQWDAMKAVQIKNKRASTRYSAKQDLALKIFGTYKSSYGYGYGYGGLRDFQVVYYFKVQPILSPGNLTITVDSGTPPSSQLIAGASNQELAKFKFTADAVTDIVIQKIIVSTVNSGNVSSVGALNVLKLFDGSTQIGESVVPASYNNVIFTGLNILIPKNNNKIITVKGDIMQFYNGFPSGAAFSLALLPDIGSGQESITAIGANNASLITGEYLDYGLTPDINQTANAMYVYKSYPVASHIPLTSAESQIVNNSSQTIYKFKIEPGGSPTSVKQMKFDLTWTNLGAISGTSSSLALKNLKFFRGDTDISSLVNITDASGNEAESGNMPISMDDTAAGIVIGFINEEQISSPTSYSIKATPINFDSTATSSDQISIKMVGDHSGHNGTKRYVYYNNVWKLAEQANGSGATDYNFIWSDLSAVAHSASSGMSTNDWFNGYLVNNLDLNATVLTK